MPSDTSVNDAILQPFLMAQDFAESQRQLMILLSEHAEARIRGIIMARLRFYFSTPEHREDFEDLYSEAKTRLVTYLHQLKEDLRVAPCKDFKGYVAAIAHNSCHDYFRQMYPARARLRKRIRDLLNAHLNFALWKSQEQNKSEWLCGFHCWRGRGSSSNSTAWLQRFYENPAVVIEALASGGDIQRMEIDDLLASIFKDVGEPISVTDVVNLVSDIRGVKDPPVASFDANGGSFESATTRFKASRRLGARNARAIGASLAGLV